MAAYAFGSAWVSARERLRGLEDLLDTGTIDRLEALGVGGGWRCLEIGAGGGTIAEWLCARVGTGGAVMATDLDTRFLEALRCPNLTALRHDIAAEDLPVGPFDLVLSRLVLEHIPARSAALTRMRSALAPGGWLVCEDTDNASVKLISPVGPDAAALFMRIEQAKDRMMAARGHRYCGAELRGWLTDLGLRDVHAQTRAPIIRAGTAAARWKKLSVDQLAKDIADANLASEAEIAAYGALLDRHDFVCRGFTVTAAWGRFGDGSSPQFPAPTP